MSTGLLKNHLLFEGHLQFLISSHSPQKTFTYFAKYRLKKSSKYCMMIIFEIFHCNMYWFRLSFLWLICFHRFFVFLIFFQLFKIILGLQHKIVALAPGRKIPALVYSLVFRLFASRAYRLESWVDHNKLDGFFYSVRYVNINYSVKHSAVDCRYLLLLQYFFL